MSNYDEQAKLRELAKGLPKSMVDALTGKFPTHADAEECKAITKELADAPRTTAEQLRYMRDMKREMARAAERLEAQIASGPKHSYGENCIRCEGYCLAFPNWSKSR